MYRELFVSVWGFVSVFRIFLCDYNDVVDDEI